MLYHVGHSNCLGGESFVEQIINITSSYQHFNIAMSTVSYMYKDITFHYGRLWITRVTHQPHVRPLWLQLYTCYGIRICPTADFGLPGSYAMPMSFKCDHNGICDGDVNIYHIVDFGLSGLHVILIPARTNQILANLTTIPANLVYGCPLVDFGLPGSHTNPMSSPWLQSCWPHPRCWQPARPLSVNVHIRSSSQMGPEPRLKKAVGASCAARLHKNSGVTYKWAA